MALAEDQLGVVRVEVREAFAVLPAKVVVVTRDEILDLEAIDECLGVDLLGARAPELMVSARQATLKAPSSAVLTECAMAFI